MRRTDATDWSDVASLRCEPVAGPERNVHSDHTHVFIVPTAGAIGRYRGVPEGVRAGRTYGTNAGKPVSRLAPGKARLAISLLLLAFVVGMALWVALGATDVPPAMPAPSVPPVSPHLR